MRSKPCVDHTGKEFPSLKAMVDYWGCTVMTVSDRLRRGWSVHDALLKPSRSDYRGDVVVDPNGVQFNSERLMVKSWGVPWVSYLSAKEQGLPLINCLKAPEGSKGFELIACPKGVFYSSYRAMAKAYGVDYQVFYTRYFVYGMSLEDSLREVSTHNGKTEIAYDHLGLDYPSLSEMCRTYSLDVGTYRSRLDSGWSVERALTTPSNRSKLTVTDHKGILYPSVFEMCLSYGVPVQTFRRRLKRGLSLEEALTAESVRTGRPPRRNKESL